MQDVWKVVFVCNATEIDGLLYRSLLNETYKSVCGNIFKFSKVLYVGTHRVNEIVSGINISYMIGYGHIFKKINFK